MSTERCAAPRILLSGAGSGSGKTTMTLGLLSALQRRGIPVQGFKCGPDYIDPMYHAAASGRPGYHLDPFFSNTHQLRQQIGQRAVKNGVAVIEGAMGFYDGIGNSWECSAYTVSEQTETPVLLVLYPGGMGCSAAAVCQGFQRFVQPNRICGVLLSRARGGMYAYYRDMIESHTGLRVYGYLPDLPKARLENRHLGLLTADEAAGLGDKLELLGETAEKTLDLDGILELAAQAPPVDYTPVEKHRVGSYRLGVAQDMAFCFYYEENLELLRDSGAELVPISPLQDACLPKGLDGLYFGGGYPELHLRQLSGNRCFIEALRDAVQRGMPVYGECGGFLYLQQAFVDADGRRWPMAGILPGESGMTDHLVRFGYVTLTAQTDTLLLAKGESVRAHEFHYGDSSDNGNACLVQRPGGCQRAAVQQQGNVMAGFPHVYFPSCPHMAQRFSAACLRYHEKQS